MVRGWKSKSVSLKAQAAKDEAEANRAIVDNWKQYADAIKADNEAYRERTDKKIEELQTEITKLKERDKIKEEALSQGWRCNHFQQEGECPILDRFSTK